jgi:predicted dinucleotide-binding enzyme
MDVTIIGAGNMERGVGTRLVAGGHQVSVLGKEPRDAGDGRQRARGPLLSDYADADRVAEALSPQHPTVIRTTLPEWEEEDLLRADG